jgi:hypothetical protein
MKALEEIKKKRKKKELLYEKKKGGNWVKIIIIIGVRIWEKERSGGRRVGVWVGFCYLFYNF